MGKRGPLPGQQDPAGGLAALQNLPATPAPVDVPAAPDGLLDESVLVWQAFWFSRAATWVDRHSALPRLRRWIRDVDQYTRILADVQPGVRAGMMEDPDDTPDDLEPQPHGGALKRTRPRLVPDPDGVPGVFDSARPWLGIGSTGQITQHPSTSLLADLDQRIHRAEVEFGMTPLAAVRLAGAGVQGALTAEQLRKMLAESGTAPEPDADAPWAAGLAPATS